MTFDPGANSEVTELTVQPDGRILVGGGFTTLGGGGSGTTPRNTIGRLNPDGSIDTTFNPGADGVVLVLVIQADGKILVGGYFTTLGGGGSGTTARNNIGRLNPDGTLDADFDPGANSFVDELIVQPDGRILVAGYFTTLGGGGTGTTTRLYIGRLGTTTPPATKPLNISTRMQVLTDDNVLIGGFIVTGIAPKKVIVRAIGPSLTAFGVQGALSDPTLDLNAPDGSVTSNYDWRESQHTEIEATGLQPTAAAESAILQTLVPGAYTAVGAWSKRRHGRRVGGSLRPRPVGRLQAGQYQHPRFHRHRRQRHDWRIHHRSQWSGRRDRASASDRAIVENFGVANALQDPVLELHSGNGDTISTNDDWRDMQETEIAATGLMPTDDRESASLQTLAPGNYTAIVRGALDITVGLVEVYHLQ